MVAVNSAFLRWMNIVAFAFTVIVNSLAGGTTLLGGKLTAAISDANPTLVTPAGYVFSIWGIIYILLGVFAIFQVLPSQKGKEFHEKIGWLFVLSSLFNITWLFLWQFEYLIFSVAIMFLLLISLIAVYVRLSIGKSKVALREKLAVHLPFSVYLGWITIATIADVSVTLVSLNWNGSGINAETWAALVIVVALIITLLVVTTRKDVAFALVIIWALVGIAVKQSSNQTVAILTEISALIIAIALGATMVFMILRQR